MPAWHDSLQPAGTQAFDSESAERWDVHVSSPCLEFRDGATKCTRPSHARPYPAALVLAPRVTFEILDLPEANNALTFGAAAWPGFQVDGGAGFGPSSASSGVEMHNTSANVRVFFDGVRQDVILPRILRGDVVSMDCDSSTGILRVTVFRGILAVLNQEFPMPPGDFFVLGATLPNNTVLEVVPEQMFVLSLRSAMLEPQVVGSDGFPARMFLRMLWNLTFVGVGGDVAAVLHAEPGTRVAWLREQLAQKLGVHAFQLYVVDIDARVLDDEDSVAEIVS